MDGQSIEPETIPAQADRCECGTPLADHPPLPKAGPFPSWRSTRVTGGEGSPRAAVDRRRRPHLRIPAATLAAIVARRNRSDPPEVSDGP